VGDDEARTGQRTAEPDLAGHELPVDPDRPSATGSPAPAQPRQRRATPHPGTIAAIAVGGAAGTLGRVELTRLIPTVTNGFPWATFAANVTGAFVVGLVIVLVLDRLPPTRYLRPLLGTGFCGGLTTFSTLVVEIDLLVKSGHVSMAIAYLAATLCAGMVAVWAGISLARISATGRRPRSRQRGGHL
jgi:CrcB protein